VKTALPDTRHAPAARPGLRDHTRDRVARTLLESGPLTATALAARLGITAAAVRRHLDGLLADGLIQGREARQVGPRGRGRPAREFAVTSRGRDVFEQAYDDLAVAALRFLAATGGPEALSEFARSRFADLEQRLAPLVARTPPGERVALVADALTADGYAASAARLASGGEQICQHHCPVSHVAEQFPQLCEAETDMLARLLGTHVARLATIAHGDGVCTTYVPASPTTGHQPEPAGRPSSERTLA
jgi:predicted ArsR family transcriptional regulator